MRIQFLNFTSVLACLLLIACGAPEHGLDSSSSLGLLVSAESAGIFTQTLHPILKTNCGSCHGAGQSPQFAVSDVDAAHTTIIQGGLVDFQAPSNSRLALKVRAGHNQIASSVADQIEAQVQLWFDGIQASGGQVDQPLPLEPTFTSISQRILEPKCTACHGALKADEGVRYDTYQLTMRTVKAFNVNDSKLYTEVAEGKMPPKLRLSNEEIQVIADWINLGAPNN